MVSVVKQYPIPFRTDEEAAVGGFGEAGDEIGGAAGETGEVGKGMKPAALGVDDTDAAFGCTDPSAAVLCHAEGIDGPVLKGFRAVVEGFWESLTGGYVPGKYAAVDSSHEQTAFAVGS